MSHIHRYTPGLGEVGAYQASARPFLTSSLVVPDNSSDPLEINFETVSRFIIVTNTSNPSAASRPIRMGFSANGVMGVEDNNFIVLDNGETFEAEFRVIKLFLSADSIYEGEASVVAGLTGIPYHNLLNNWSGSLGVG